MKRGIILETNKSIAKIYFLNCFKAQKLDNRTIKI